MKKIIVDAKAFAEAMGKVSRVLKKSAIPMLEEIAVSVKDADAARWPRRTWTHGSWQSFRPAAMIYPSFFRGQRM